MAGKGVGVSPDNQGWPLPGWLARRNASAGVRRHTGRWFLAFYPTSRHRHATWSTARSASVQELGEFGVLPGHRGGGPAGGCDQQTSSNWTGLTTDVDHHDWFRRSTDARKGSDDRPIVIWAASGVSEMMVP